MKRPPSDSPVIRVAVRDNSHMATHLLCAALAREPGFEVIGVEDRGAAEIAAITPHVALVSAGAQPLKAFELLRELRKIHPDTKAVLLLEESTRELVLEAFRSGARGVFCLSESFDSLIKCISSVHGGQVWANQSEIKFLLQAISEPLPMRLVDAKGSVLLSRREQSIVACLAEGLTNREIARQLELSEHTVKNYLFRIFDKLGISSRVELILYAVSQLRPALVAPPESVKITDSQDPAVVPPCPEQTEQWQFRPYLLAQLYREGQGVASDKVTALMWFKVAEALAGEVRGNSRMAQHQLRSAMTPEQIAEAERRAAEWLHGRPNAPRLSVG